MDLPLRLVPRLYRQLEALRPLRKRSIIHAHARVPEQVVQREIHMTRLESAVTVGDDRSVGSDALRRVAGAQLVSRLPHRGEVHLDQVALPEMTDRPGDVPTPELRTRAAGILVRVARIDDDAVARAQGSPHVLERRPVRSERGGPERR